MESNSIQSFLINELERIDKWLSFGEAKNAALVAFNVAVLSVNMDFGFPLLLTMLRVFIVLSMAISLMSFWPNMSKRVSDIKLKPYSNGPRMNNYLYFLDIARLASGDEYLQIVKSRYLIEEIDITSTYCCDLANEIIINSRIAVKKYKYFRSALMCDFIAMFFVVLIFICA